MVVVDELIIPLGHMIHYLRYDSVSDSRSNPLCLVNATPSIVQVVKVVFFVVFFPKVIVVVWFDIK